MSNNLFLKAFPLFVSIYFYLIPKFLVGNYIDKFIETNFHKYAKDHSDNIYMKLMINRIISFISFISTFGSIIISVLCDKSFKWGTYFIVAGVIFFGSTMYLFTQYTANNLELSKRNIIYEKALLFIAILALILNSFLQ